MLALLLWPLVWLISDPLRLAGIGLEAVFALLQPARLLGQRR